MVKKIEKINQIQCSEYNSSYAHQKSHYDKIEIRGKSDKFQFCHSIQNIARRRQRRTYRDCMA